MPDDPASLRAEVEALKAQRRELAGRVRRLEEMVDTRSSWWWKRLWWRVDGWPPWHVVGSRMK